MTGRVLLTVLLGIQSLLAEEFGCPRHFPRLNDECFSLVRLGLTFDEGKDFCEASMMGHLVYILSEEENQVVLDLLREEGVELAWIGLRDMFGSGEWRWMTSPDNQKAEYVNWEPGGVPYTETKRICVEMVASSGNWRATPCFHDHDVSLNQLPTVCRIPVNKPKTGIWSPWSPMDSRDCTASCGGGFRLERRTCLSNSCNGRRGQQFNWKPCNGFPCPLPQWGEWSAWSPCSVTCSFGERRRTRQCAQVGRCSKGDSEETKMCYEVCPSFSDWALWHDGVMACTFQQEWLHLPSGIEQVPQLKCEGPSLTGQWGDWQNCGSHLRWRPSIPNQNTCFLRESISGTRPDCPSPLPLAECGWEPWPPWPSCSRSCGGGTRRRERKQTGISHCTAVSVENDCCASEPCPYWTEWSEWSVCSGTCEFPRGETIRARQCWTFGEKDELGGRSCHWTKNGEVCNSFEDCKLDRLNCTAHLNDTFCTDTTTVTPITFEELTVGEQVATVVGQAVGTLGSLFLVAVCSFEFVAYILIRYFSPQRILQMSQEFLLILSHLSILFMTQADSDQGLCLFVGIGLNFCFDAFFCLLAVEALQVMAFKGRVIPSGTLFPWLLYAVFVIGVPVAVTTALGLILHDTAFIHKSPVHGGSMCWANLTTVDVPRAYFVVYSFLFALAMIFIEASGWLTEIWDEYLPDTDWDQQDDAEFLYTGMYLKIILAYGSFSATLGALHTSIEYPLQPSTLLASAISLGFNLAFGGCIFFYHSFGNVKVRGMVQKMKEKMRDVLGRMCPRREVMVVTPMEDED